MHRNTTYILTLMLALIMTVTANAAKLSWEAGNDDDLAGYKIYCGSVSGAYQDTIDVGNVLEYPLEALAAGQSYYLAVSAYDNWGNQSELSTEVAYEPMVQTDVDEDSSMPLDFSLKQNYPNPFNPETNIVYSVDGAGAYELSVYNIRGQHVRTLVDSDAPMQGVRSEVMWDGCDESGQPVSSGVYFYRLRQGDKVSTKQMSLTR